MARISKAPGERREEILNTAKELFFTKGYENTSVNDIVGRIGVAQGLFYYYFKSKEEVFRAVMEYAADDFVQKLQAALLCEGKSLAERFQNMLLLMSEMADTSDHVLMDEAHLAEHMALHERMAMHVSQSLIEPLANELTKQMEQGKLHVDDPRTTAIFIIYGVSGIIHDGDGMLHSNIKENLQAIPPLLERILGAPLSSLQGSWYVDDNL